LKGEYAMAKVKLILVGGDWRAEKWFDWSDRPFEGDREFIKLRPDGGYAPVKIDSVHHYTEEDVYEAICEDNLTALCRLFLENQIDDGNDRLNSNWHMVNFSQFKANPKVLAELKKIERLIEKHSA
jgi:hypothetical protein